MPDVTITRTTNLRGNQLRTTVFDMMLELTGRSPYSLVRLSTRWENADRIILDAPGHVSGAVDIRDGSPSTVTVQLNLLSSLAQNQRARVILDVNQLADQRLGGETPLVEPTSSSSRTTTSTQTSSARRAVSQSSVNEASQVMNMFADAFRRIGQDFRPSSQASAAPAPATTQAPRATVIPAPDEGYVKTLPSRFHWGWVIGGGAVAVTALLMWATLRSGPE